VPELIDVLVERLDPTDLQSLLLEVYRRRTVGVKPSQSYAPTFAIQGLPRRVLSDQ